MKLIVGLGNPELRYENTYHNLGFIVIDKLIEKLNLTVSKKAFNGIIYEYNKNGEKVLIVKPQTYMNLSGNCVSEIVNYYKIDLEKVIVAYDDFDLPLGKIRIRTSGSAGTHNGMRSIVNMLGGDNFKRIRIGFKKELGFMPLMDYVLSKIDASSQIELSSAIDNAVNALIDFIDGVAFDKILQKRQIL